MRIDRYVHDERLTWGAAGVLLIVSAIHLTGIGALFVTQPKREASTALPPVFQVSLERLPPPKLPPTLEPESPPEPASVQETPKGPPKKTRPVPILVDTPVEHPVPPDTQVKQYEMGDEKLEGEPGPPSPPGAVVGGTGEALALSTHQGVPVIAKVQLVRMKPPVYPPRCLRMGVEGVVKVRVLVGEDGVPQEVTLARSSGDSSLDESAMEAVKDWIFKPATRDGMPIRAWAIVPIEFKLID
ncbi:MAG: energy transducer TonB [Gammaproteobacteria bacterium]|nr:energy transducer TonB [Gammaproteobacteria bacterium]